MSALPGVKSPELAERLSIARLLAMRAMPYCRFVLQRMPVVESRHHNTMAVDAEWRLYVNKEWTMALSVGQTAFILLHEAWHLLREHAVRAGRKGITDETHFRWNLACDAELNDDLMGLKYGVTMPTDDEGKPDLILPATLGMPEGMLAEQYFDHGKFPEPPEPDDREREPWKPPRPGGSCPPGGCKPKPPWKGYKVGDRVIIRSTGAPGVVTSAGPWSPCAPQAVTIEPAGDVSGAIRDIADAISAFGFAARR